MIKVFIVDDHSLIREGFRKIIEKENDIAVIGEAGSAKDFFSKFKTADCDLVILDINLPDKNGLEVLKDIKIIKPQMHVLILSMYPEERYAIRTFKAGASGYIPKENAADTLIGAIRKVMAGGKYVSEELAQNIAFNLGHKGANVHDLLSDRELQILLLIGSGKSIHEIAETLNLSINTINTYRKRVLEKMNLKSNADIIRYVIQNKLVE
jgi:two-component system, NarL family, invasion response regulator UvrY